MRFVLQSVLRSVQRSVLHLSTANHLDHAKSARAGRASRLPGAEEDIGRSANTFRDVVIIIHQLTIAKHSDLDALLQNMNLLAHVTEQIALGN